MSTEVSVEHGVTYGEGKLLDVYRPERTVPPSPTVLLWHGAGPDERDVLATLAAAVAGLHGLTVVVPDWRPDAADGGRSHLLASLAFTRSQTKSLGGLGEDAIVLAGWSRGGRCAAAIAVRPAAVAGWRPMSVVGLSAGYSNVAPVTSGAPLADLAVCHAEPVPFWLVHGIEDTAVPISTSAKWAALLNERGWPVRFEKAATDHAGVIGTQYDPGLQRCVRAAAAHAQSARDLSARMIAEAAKELPAGPWTRPGRLRS